MPTPRSAAKSPNPPARRSICLLLGCALALASYPGALAQHPSAISSNAPAATPPITFDVVSIKENPGPNYEFMGVMDTADGLHAVAALKQLVAAAFSMRPEFISCKLSLCDEPVYEIRAKLLEPSKSFTDLSYPEKSHLLQSILQDRFGLRSHTETRPTNVYNLVVAKAGLKLQAPPANRAQDKSGTRGSDGVVMIMSDHLRGFAVSMDSFVPVLSQFVGDAVGRPINNKTALTGTYDVDLKWTDSLHQANSASNETASAPTDNGPDLFTALQEQLGLELKPAKESIPILVIDAAHSPSPD